MSIKHTLTPLVVALCVIGVTLPVSAMMSDTEFKNLLLQEIQAQENLTDEEMSIISTELEGISQKGILDDIADEISYLEDVDFKKEMQIAYRELEQNASSKVFFDLIDSIYTELDAHYIEIGEAFWDDEYDFESNKQDIIASLMYEKEYLNDEALENLVEASIAKLEKETNEDNFYEILELVYEKIDEHYGEMDSYENFMFGGEYDFETIKNQFISSFEIEKTFINDETINTKINSVIEAIELVTTEEKLFDILDAFYTDKDVIKYFDQYMVDFREGDEMGIEFEIEMDLDRDRDLIIGFIKEELTYVKDAALKKKLNTLVIQLEKEENEDKFLEQMTVIYDMLGGVYSEQNK